MLKAKNNIIISFLHYCQLLSLVILFFKQANKIRQILSSLYKVFYYSLNVCYFSYLLESKKLLFLKKKYLMIGIEIYYSYLK